MHFVRILVFQCHESSLYLKDKPVRTIDYGKISKTFYIESSSLISVHQKIRKCFCESSMNLKQNVNVHVILRS